MFFPYTTLFRSRGYVGVILGLPDSQYHLEFTHHQDGSPCPAPTTDNLLVFYIPNKKEIDRIIERLSQMGYEEVEPANGYWKEKGKTVEDPDGWRIDRKSTRLNSSHVAISYAVFC